MSYVRENDSTQNAHIKHSNDTELWSLISMP